MVAGAVQAGPVVTRVRVLGVVLEESREDTGPVLFRNAHSAW